MAVTPIQSAYATITEADAYLAIRSDWLVLTNVVKDDALLWARYFIDTNFNCVVDYDVIAEEVKYANSLLAYDYFVQGDLYFDNEQVIKSKKVGAGKGAVLTEKTFQNPVRTRPNSMSKVVSVLKSICQKTSGTLIRV